jgi:hypothetical protein
MSWQDYKFLESASNVRTFLTKALDREPNTSVATEIATCLRQGRMFFEAAKDAPLDIRPLLVQYGVIAMGKALASARTLTAMNTFTQSHGLSDTSPYNASLEGLSLAVGGSGSFHEFNNAARLLDVFRHYGPKNEQRRVFLEYAASSHFVGKAFTFHDLFSRLPNQQTLYLDTFSRAGNCLDTHIYSESDGTAPLTVTIREKSEVDLQRVQTIVAKLRSEFPFLQHWALHEIEANYGELKLKFLNLDRASAPDATRVHVGPRNFFEEEIPPLPCTPTPLDKMPLPIQGSLFDGGNGIGAIQALHGINCSLYAVIYMATFMLGSLVRYRPQTWIHALTSKITNDRALDDHSVALVEAFLDDVLSKFPVIIMQGVTIRRENIMPAS